MHISALTVIDTCTTLTEIVRLENKTAAHVGHKFEQSWLARYPRPLRCIHDPGSEFIGANFQLVLANMDIEPVPTTVKNLQANAICEHMHKMCGDMLRTLLREHPPQNVENAYELIDAVLAAAQRSLRCCIHRTFGITPGAMVFGRDMLLPIPVLTDYNLIRERKQTLIDENNRRTNLRRHFKDYQINDEVLLLVYGPTKLQNRAEGPFRITQVHVNGTVTIQRAPGVVDRVNIRRLRPYTRR